MNYEKKRILITVKTYPHPSATYQELVCTAGVLENGSFIRLYPIDYRYMPYWKWYKKYQWIEVEVIKNDKDSRRESYRPKIDTIKPVSEPISTKNNWQERKKYVLAKGLQTIEQLNELKSKDKTSLGIIRPKEICDLIIEPALMYGRGNGKLCFSKTDFLALIKSRWHYEWSFRRMKSDTELISTEDGYNNILTAISRLTELINIDNPVQTIKEGLFHYEYPVFPIEVLREALLNAFSHRDFTKPGPIMVKQFKDRLEISNSGMFIGGVTPKNILHHDPVARNRKLVEILQKTRLVNRSNMGVPRIFKNLLMEGKEPPAYYEDGETIKVIFQASELTAGFRNMIAYLTDKGHDPKIDHLLIIHYLMRHRRMTLQDAQEICYQRPERVMDEIMTEMERMEVIKSIGKGRGRFF
jgi:predicted HTH transcriptional regulator